MKFKQKQIDSLDQDPRHKEAIRGPLTTVDVPYLSDFSDKYRSSPILVCQTYLHSAKPKLRIQLSNTTITKLLSITINFVSKKDLFRGKV